MWNMEKHFLNAEELLKTWKHGSLELPQRGGIKDYAPSDSWFQDKKIDIFYREHAEVLEEQRVKNLGGTALGEWKPERKKVLVHTTPGKFWNQVGHVEDQLKWLYPEEALFLLDQGLMEIKYGGVPLTLQEAYSTVLAPQCPMERYQVYAHLRRLGFIVRRHTLVYVPTRYERQLRLDQHCKETSQKGKKKRRNKPLTDNSLEQDTFSYETDLPLTKRSKHTNSNDPNGDYSNLLPGDKCGVGDKMDCDSDISGAEPGGRGFYESEPAITKTGNASMGQKYGNWDFACLNFPDLSLLSLQDTTEIEITIPPIRYLPSEVRRESNSFKVKPEQLRTNLCPHSADEHCALDFSLNDRPLSTTASNWGEYKKRFSVQSDHDILVSSPVGVLWSEDVKPLVSPLDAYNTESILHKLKVIENVKLTQAEDISSQSASKVRSDMEIVYDVYLPNSKFRKTEAGRPDHRIVIMRQQDKPPTLSEVVQLSRQCMDAVPLHWAVNDEGSLAFYRFMDVDIPMDISMG